MKRYDSYKDSGVEWIGEIPSHWINQNLIINIIDRERSEGFQRLYLRLKEWR